MATGTPIPLPAPPAAAKPAAPQPDDVRAPAPEMTDEDINKYLFRVTRSKRENEKKKVLEELFIH